MQKINDGKNCKGFYGVPLIQGLFNFTVKPGLITIYNQEVVKVERSGPSAPAVPVAAPSKSQSQEEQDLVDDYT
jgi:hypothetical protein